MSDTTISAPAELAEQQGELPPLPEAYGEITYRRKAGYIGRVEGFTRNQMKDYARAALSATGKQQVGEVQGDALSSLPLYRLADDANGKRGLHRDDTGSWVKIQDVERALAARQPVVSNQSSGNSGELGVEGARQPGAQACTNCDRTDTKVICQNCAGLAWDTGRLHEFHDTRELHTSLGDGSLDHLIPDEWHEKPLLRFQGVCDVGDDSVGVAPRSGNVLAADQAGTVLGDYLAARAAKEGGQ
ncbi:hypothetical protein [Stenotrophomonas sp. GZD-301]|uniref:hypothetical protein n=1 Tax=Stenotrophomonas sp. GZD-301 TaxID=3404814 RepID=UPI003BB71C74